MSESDVCQSPHRDINVCPENGLRCAPVLVSADESDCADARAWVRVGAGAGPVGGAGWGGPEAETRGPFRHAAADQ
eukprot:3141684-Rhodomonas_salina.2